MPIALMARPNPQRQVLFNTDFEPLTPMFWCHIACIQAGGRWKKPNGEYAGMGNFYHYKEAQKILWPEKEWHKWNDLLLKNFLDHRIIGVLGPASSGKTYEAATFALIFYYSHSDTSTILVSSTEREMLEMRVWGEMKKAHKLATSRMHGLPGILVESRQRLVTDDRSIDSEGRDFRCGVTAIPCKKGGQFVGLGCFPAGQLVDTPSGKVPIEDIRGGDRVSNANNYGLVMAVTVREAPLLVRVHRSDGTSFDCTPEHRIFTNFGWVKAIDLTTQHLLISADEAMHILRGKAHRKTEDVLLHEMQVERAEEAALLHNLQQDTGEAATGSKEVLLEGVPAEILGEKLSAMRKTVSTERGSSEFLQQILRSELEVGSARDSEEIQKQKNRLASLQSEMQRDRASQSSGEEASKPKDAQADFGRYNPASPKTKWFMEWYDSQSGGGHAFPIPGSQAQLPNPDGTVFEAWKRSTVRDGSGMARHQIECGIGWPISQSPRAEEEGRGPNSVPFGKRVDRVEVLKPDGDERFEKSAGGYRVYNLEVEGHPSYSINGTLVHNSYVGIKNKHVILVADEGAFMPRAYVDAISNLNKNKGFKCIVLGNPKETTDALGVICEPSAELGGWDGGIDQAPMTKTWPTRFKDGICVQLVGSDCPNMDVPKDAPVPYPFLITREAIEADVAFYGMDSIQYSMMNEGRMPRGQGLRRVITRAMCLKFGAMEAPVWKSDERTRIGFLDAAYGSVGGDRCVFGELQIGKDPNDREIMAVIDTMLVPVTTTSPELPEDQIALFVKGQCEQRRIKPEDVFFDATGRGSLVGAFARLWSAHVGTVEFGGKPSERYVSDNIRVLCKDYYSKFVTELWYSVALTIQSGQFRGMTEDILLEGSMREWGFVGGNKIEIEPKDKMKLKSGRSPDLFDALACGVEGARRRGFHIAKLTNVGATADNGWRLDLAKRMERVKKRHTLNYAS